MKKEKSTILIVEDDASLRDTLAAFLTRVGYEVMTAHDGGQRWPIRKKQGKVIQPQRRVRTQGSVRIPLEVQ